MKKWAISAVVYLLVVTGGYYAYASFTGAEPEKANHATKEEQHNTGSEHTENSKEEEHGDSHTEHEETSGNSEEGDHEDNHSEHEATAGSSEVLPTITEENGDIIITLKEQNGDVVSDLEVNHEKLMHLIVVSTDLGVYKHLHPVSNQPGIFKVKHGLEDGEYKLFVDIKPKDLSYEVQPIELMIGNSSEGHNHGALSLDKELMKQVDNHKVTLEPTSLSANEEIQLNFDLHGETPEQYLGALGHVVILDEKAQNYIHVHPLEGKEPVFQTKFSKPGIYKIWSEFQFDGEVFVFPYVVEIK
jgi:hypothetical protein